MQSGHLTPQLSCPGLLCLLLLSAWLCPVSSQCATAGYQRCPSALAAAQMLTANSSYLPISSASWSGPTSTNCSVSQQYSPAIIIPSFPSCNFLASSMPTGALVSGARSPLWCDMQRHAAVCASGTCCCTSLGRTSACDKRADSA